MHYTLLIGLMLAAATAWGKDQQSSEKTPASLTKPVETDTLMQPEREVQFALYRLENLKHKFSGDQLLRMETAGSQTQQAKRLIKLGADKFAKKEWFTAIAVLEQFLAVSQAANGEDYLLAHRLLGYSYEQVGNGQRARHAYQNFLASYMTRPLEGEQELLDVLKKLLPLVQENDVELASLLAPLATLRISQRQKAEVYYFAGLNLAKAGRKDLASRWFREARNLSESPRARAGATYQLGMLAMDNKDLASALKEFSLCLTIAEDQAKDYRDLAHIGLARIAIVDKKPALAVKHYESVSKDSAAFADALFEHIYIQVALRNFAKARDLSKTLAEKYPKHPQLHLVTTIKGFLDIKAGDWPKAKETIATSDKDLKRLEDWLSEKFKQPHKPEYRDLVELLQRTEGYLTLPPVVARSIKIFERLAELEDRLGGIRNDNRSLLYGVGTSSLQNLHPVVLARFNQLEEYLIETLEVGNRLAALEAHLFKDKLAEKEKAELTASQKRRYMLYSNAAKLQGIKGNWQAYAHFAELQIKTSKSIEKLLQAKAELAGMLNHVLFRQPSDAKNKLASLQKLQHSVNLRLEQTSRAMELVRGQQIQMMAGFGPQRPLMRRVRLYASALFEETALTATYRNRVNNAHQRYLMEDIKKTWVQWEFVLKGLYEQLAQEDQRLQKNLTRTVTDAEAHIMRNDQLNTRLFALNRQIGNTLSTNAEGIVAYYHDQVEERIARHKKWQADLEWLAYAKENEKKGEVDRKYELEQQMLQDNLRNLRQGATLPW